MQKDLIVFMGPSGCGKTEGINRAKLFFAEHSIAYHPKPIADGPFILQQLTRDHERTGGKNHYHDWCAENVHGHVHPKKETDFSFTVFGYPIVHGMYTDFFKTVAGAPQDGKFIFVEWSGGVAQRPNDAMHHTADYSYTRMVQEFKTGAYDATWFSRIAAVIHPVVSDFETRLWLNDKRQVPNVHEIEFGERSWPLPPAAMQSFAGDDAHIMQAYLRAQGVSHILDVTNNAKKKGLDGTPDYIRQLDKTFEVLFTPYVNQERMMGQKKEGGGR